MRIKLSFITNSSSTAYIAIIPKNFIVREDLFTLLKSEYDSNFKSELEDYCDGDKLQMLEHVGKGICTLLEGKPIWPGDFSCFYTIKDYLKAKNLVIKEIEIDGGSGYDTIDPISLEEIKNVLERFKENESKIRVCNK